MGLHDYIIISQNKQDNFRLCAILDYHLASSGHDERVAKVGPAMRITELEAKSKAMFRCKIFERESCYLGVLNKIYLQIFFARMGCKS